MSQEITIAGIGIAPEVLAAIVSRSVEQVEGVASVGVKDLATNLVSMFSAKSTQVGEDLSLIHISRRSPARPTSTTTTPAPPVPYASLPTTPVR